MGLMKRFIWKGLGSEEDRGMALVSWDLICRSANQGGQRVINLQAMNLAMLTKCVAKIMNSKEDLALRVQRDSYNWL